MGVWVDIALGRNCSVVVSAKNAAQHTLNTEFLFIGTCPSEVTFDENPDQSLNPCEGLSNLEGTHCFPTRSLGAFQAESGKGGGFRAELVEGVSVLAFGIRHYHASTTAHNARAHHCTSTLAGRTPAHEYTRTDGRAW